MTESYPVEIDTATGQVAPLPQERGRRYRCKLGTLADVKGEMAKVYRECRSELIDPATGSKLVFMLQSIGRVIEGSELERRIEKLEAGRGDS